MRSTLAVSSAVMAALWISSASAQEKDADAFRSGSLGFCVRKPGEDWDFHETGDKGKGAIALAICPKSLKGIVQVTIRANRSQGFGISPSDLRDRALEATAGKAEYSNPSKISWAN